MKKHILIFIFLIGISLFVNTQRVKAVDCNEDPTICVDPYECQEISGVWQCVNTTTCPGGYTNNCKEATINGCTAGYECRLVGCTRICVSSGGGGTTNSDNPFGTIKNPFTWGGTAPGGGLIILLNNVLRLFFTAAGIFAFFRIITAGFGFMNAAGDAKKIEAAWAAIWQSLLGLAVIISSFAIAAVAGQAFFGNPMAILNPQIYGPSL